jgi:hypothetical protein
MREKKKKKKRREKKANLKKIMIKMMTMSIRIKKIKLRD